MLDTIVEGTRHTLEFAHECGVKKFLFTSSGAVYGEQPVNTPYLPEDYLGAPDMLDPQAAYGEGKRIGEFLCSFYAGRYGIETKIARCFAFIGPYLPLDVHFAVGNFIRDGLAGGPIKVMSDGTPYRSYLYSADLAIWLWTILFKGVSCRPYNVGSEQSITIGELAREVVQVLHPKMQIQLSKHPDPNKRPERYVPSTRRARAELGLKESIGLLQAIEKTVAWYRRMMH